MWSRPLPYLRSPPAPRSRRPPPSRPTRSRPASTPKPHGGTVGIGFQAARWISFGCAPRATNLHYLPALPTPRATYLHCLPLAAAPRLPASSSGKGRVATAMGTRLPLLGEHAGRRPQPPHGLYLTLLQGVLDSTGTPSRVLALGLETGRRRAALLRRVVRAGSMFDSTMQSAQSLK